MMENLKKIELIWRKKKKNTYFIFIIWLATKFWEKDTTLAMIISPGRKQLYISTLKKKQS